LAGRKQGTLGVRGGGTCRRADSGGGGGEKHAPQPRDRNDWLANDQGPSKPKKRKKKGGRESDEAASKAGHKLNTIPVTKRVPLERKKKEK